MGGCWGTTKGSVGGGCGATGDAGGVSWGLGALPKVTVRRPCESAMGPRAVPVRHGRHAAVGGGAVADVGVGGARRHGSDGGSWAGATTGAGTALARSGAGAADIARSLTQKTGEKKKRERERKRGKTVDGGKLWVCE